MGKIYNWFQERLEIQAIADDITSKYVPPHVNIFYCFGGITLTCFLQAVIEAVISGTQQLMKKFI
jgi:cytochrome b6